VYTPGEHPVGMREFCQDIANYLEDVERRNISNGMSEHVSKRMPSNLRLDQQRFIYSLRNYHFSCVDRRGVLPYSPISTRLNTASFRA
jgi:hypothetical protein